MRITFVELKKVFHMVGMGLLFDTLDQFSCGSTPVVLLRQYRYPGSQDVIINMIEGLKTFGAMKVMFKVRGVCMQRESCMKVGR